MQTAQNVHRMTKMRRPSQVLQSGIPAKKATMKSAATMVMNTTRLRPPIARRRPARRVSADLNSVHLSRRFSTSRQDSVNGTFSPNFLIHIPLSQARHFSTLDGLVHLNMQNSKGDPVTDD
ncbi:hypothetical protein PINS_up001148 [Pythium insidiosum]|nr:hypothetical protein PINS_up001148 [Pythium insidiosum]